MPIVQPMAMPMQRPYRYTHRIHCIMFQTIIIIKCYAIEMKMGPNSANKELFKREPQEHERSKILHHI